MAALNVRGLGVGKWVNNLGGIGTAVGALALMGLALVVTRHQGLRLSARDFGFAGADWRLVSTFGVICFGLVGLELGSVMGDEIEDPRRTVPGAVLWGGVISGLLYIGVTLATLLALPRNDIGVVQGTIQAVNKLARDAGVPWIVPPLALVLSISTAGIASAWFVGSARIPFVAGLDRYLPPALGKIHPRYATPYVALIVHASLSSLFVAMNLAGARRTRISLLLAPHTSRGGKRGIRNDDARNAPGLRALGEYRVRVAVRSQDARRLRFFPGRGGLLLQD
jgi:amino acid transporter